MVTRVLGSAQGGPPSVHWQVPAGAPTQLCVSLQSTGVAHGPMNGAT
jgi:hypothetical protein